MRTMLTLSTVVSLGSLLAACSSTPTGSSSPADPGVVTVAPSVAALARGASLRLTAAVKEADGTSGMPSDLTWRSSDPAIASVASGGLVLGIKAGHVQIIAEAQGITGAASVTVVESTGAPHCIEALVVGTGVPAKVPNCR
jgi:alpha-amylase